MRAGGSDQRRRCSWSLVLGWASLALGAPGCDSGSSPLDLGPADAGAEDAPRDGGRRPDAGADGGLDAGRERDAGGGDDGGVPDAGAPALPAAVRVRVTLDGAPVGGARVSYAGSGEFVETSTGGWADVGLRPVVPSFEAVITAAHPDARTGAEIVEPGDGRPLTVALRSFEATDNPSYRFGDPGTPDRRDTTNECAHCHVTLNEAWFTSAHRRSAQNETVLDLYTGVVRVDSAAACEAQGGAWVRSTLPGAPGQLAFRCHLGDGVLDVLNPSCDAPPCEGPELGDCAACHAPGIDGALAGRGLLEAESRAFAYGVHCDVCHRVESVALEAGVGVSGALRLVRPTEPGPLGLNEDGWLPLTFGPSWDSPNPKMGSVPRAHFRGPELCAACHDYDQPVRVPGAAIDRRRWPEGQLPVQSTYDEWRDGPYEDAVACQGCHMPPDPGAQNGADLQRLGDDFAGIAAGWPRPPGSVRSHAFVGPRTEGAGLLEMAAALQLRTEARDGALEVRVTTTNVGAGHALPTGIPFRQLFLRVEATACGRPLRAVGGDAIGPLGGAEAEAPGPFAGWPSGWPAPRVGDRLLVVRDRGFVDYDGPGAFAAGDRFSAAEKGRRRLTVVGASAVVALVDGRPRLEPPPPPGDRVFLARPRTGAPEALAGRPGTSFARVMVDADGRLAAPHYAAVDVVRDDRLRPRGERRTVHRFALDPTCEGPARARAWLIYRPFPRWLSLNRGWDQPDRVIAEGVR